MKLKKMLSKRQSVLISWLVSYFIVLSIPIIVNVFVFYNSVRMVEKEVNSSNIALLTQLQRIIDDQTHQIENLCLQINWNAQVKRLIDFEGKFYISEHYAAYQILNDFKAYITNNFLESFYIYLKKSNIIMGNTFISDIDLAYEAMHKSDNITFDEWKKLISEKHSLEFIPLIRKDLNGKPGNIIVFAQTLPMEHPGNISANIFITLNPKPLDDFVKEIPWISRGGILIFDKHNKIIYSDKLKGYNQWLQDDEIQIPGGISYSVINGEKVVISCVTSAYTGIKYVSILPFSIFTEKVDYIWKLTTMSTILCLLLGGVVSLWFSKKEYNIISGIVKFLTNKIGISKSIRHNEYQFIRDTMSRIFDEKELINRKLQQQHDILRGSFLTRLLKGRLQNLNLPGELFSSMDIDFKTDIFAVLLFYIESYNAALFEEDSGHAAENNIETNLLMSIKAVVGEITPEGHQAFIVEMDKTVTCLVNFGDGEEQNYETDLYDAVVKIKQMLKNKFEIEITVSISNICRGLNNVSMVYREAQDAMEYKMVLGKGEIINYNKIKEIKRNEYTYFYPLNTELHLINYVKAGDETSADRVITEIFDSNLLKGANSIELIKCLMFDLICTMIKIINELENSCEKSFLESLDPVKRLLNCETVKEMKLQITETLNRICEYLKLKKKSHNDNLKSNVVKYIEENYSDPNLSITSISDKFMVNPSYLSRFFKEQTGECILHFLNRVRLENAKRLMKEHRISVIDTAAAVGYNNSNTFIRIFKKYEGITPGNYKLP